VILVKKNIPIARGANINWALCGGEDYELLFTVDRRKADELALRFEEKFGKPLYSIGRVVRQKGKSCFVGIEREDGEIVQMVLGSSGYRHF
jgi:thiamine monophosphate kinase